MSCIHKFYGHRFHQTDVFGLLPQWEANTLIIGTFNPSNLFHPTNDALYFYGRTSNYFWDILPLFAGETSIEKNNPDRQKIFLEKNKIALTDLLISIDDAEVNNSEHLSSIQTVQDREIERFRQFTWNTNQIQLFIDKNNIEAVYFTFLSNQFKNCQDQNTFEFQTRIIENYCRTKGIFTSRLFTPSGQGLRAGKPRQNKLINKWFFENGCNRFHFLSPNFNVHNFVYS
jgi:hypothetical protein